MTKTIERKWQMVRVKAGDYLLPSNSGKSLWRIYRYEDGPSHGLKDEPRDIMLWACARWDGTPESALQADDLEHAWDRWIIVEQWLRTRQEAINEALNCAERRGM